MNATVHQIRTRKSVLPDVTRRFETLEQLVKDLGESIREDRTMMLHGRESRAAAVVEMLEERGAVTVADVKKHLGVTMKTANRLLHHVSHAGEGILMSEPAGATDRLVLFHTDRVVIDDPRKSTGQ